MASTGPRISCSWHRRSWRIQTLSFSVHAAWTGLYAWRSRVGNVLTKHVFQVLAGRTLGDTQCGLRGIRAVLVPRFLALPGEHYDFEMSMLADACRAGIPILVVAGDADREVPLDENTRPFADRVRAAGGRIELIIKLGGDHHPHSLRDPQPIVDFLLRQAAARP